jgi:hypothetical protein
MVNWDSVINECGMNNLIRFSYGAIAKRNFRQFGPNCGRVCRDLPVVELRERAQRAVRHRTTARKRRGILSRSV